MSAVNIFILFHFVLFLAALPPPFPKEIYANIKGYLDPKSVSKVRSTARLWNAGFSSKLKMTDNQGKLLGINDFLKMFEEHGHKEIYFNEFIEFKEKSHMGIRTAAEYCGNNRFLKLFRYLMRYYKLNSYETKYDVDVPEDKVVTEDYEISYDSKEKNLDWKDLFVRACKKGQARFLKEIVRMNMMVLHEDFSHVRWEIGGSLNVLKLLLNWIDVHEINLRDCFVSAARNGRLDTMQFILNYPGINEVQMIKSNYYRAFAYASDGGKLEAMRFLLSYNGIDPIAMIRSRNYLTFRDSASSGEIEIIKFLLQYPGIDVAEMVRIRGVDALVAAATGGHLKIMQYLLEIPLVTADEIIRAKGSYVFVSAAAAGQFEVIQFLLEYPGINVAQMLKSNNYYAFSVVARWGHLGTIKFLLKHAGSKSLDMIRSRSYNAFRLAAAYGHLEVVEFLLEYQGANPENMIAAAGYRSFMSAVRFNRLEIVQVLINSIPLRDARELILWCQSKEKGISQDMRNFFVDFLKEHYLIGGSPLVKVYLKLYNLFSGF